MVLAGPRSGVHEALENYATWLAQYHDVTVENTSDLFQPCYWRSEESLESSVLTNILSQAAHLRDFGLDGLLLSDGWQQEIGDWSFDTTRYPSGGEEIVLQAKNHGLVPGIWAAPLHASEDSALLTIHDAAEWTVGISEDSLDTGADGVKPLNLDRTDVTNHVRNSVSSLYSKGFEWMSVGRTAIESASPAAALDANGLALIQSAFAPGTLLREGGADHAVGSALAASADFSLNPAGRFPAWPADLRMLAAASRRWFFQGTAASTVVAPVSFPLDVTRKRLFLTALAMMGGAFELRTPPLSLNREQMTLVRQLVPPLPYAARPMDLFDHEIPEQYHMVIDGGEGMVRADLLGLLCPEQQAIAGGDELAARVQDCDVSVDLSALGLGLDTEFITYDFWTGEVDGPVASRLQTTVPLNEGRLIALRPLLDRPQFAGWNRHVSVGGRFFEKERWTAFSNTLRLSFEVTAALPEYPFPYEIVLVVPKTYDMNRVEVFIGAFSSIEWEWLDNPPADLDAKLMKLTLVPDATSLVELDLVFDSTESE